MGSLVDLYVEIKPRDLEKNGCHIRFFSTPRSTYRYTVLWAIRYSALKTNSGRIPTYDANFKHPPPPPPR